jgi:enoyl-CoA hydratase
MGPAYDITGARRVRLIFCIVFIYLNTKPCSMNTTRRLHDIDYRLDGEVAIILLDNPPVNGLGLTVRRGLVEAFELARSDARVRAIVLAGTGRGFSAGGDIREFGTPASTASPGLSLHVHPVIEGSEKPVVAALHGLAIGGGLETALVCHYRIAAGDTKVGLPELQLGVIPLSGTQRMPRVLGLTKAIELILGSRLLAARELREDGIFDRVIEGDAAAVLSCAVSFARKHVGTRPLPLIRQLAVPDTDAAAVLAVARRSVPPDDVIAQAGLNAIAASVEATDFDAGMTVAREIYDRLITSDEVRRRRDRFFAGRAGKRETP